MFIKWLDKPHLFYFIHNPTTAIASISTSAPLGSAAACNIKKYFRNLSKRNSIDMALCQRERDSVRVSMGHGR